MSLAKWLVKFRRDSPGWPAVELSMFIDAFDERALAEYRRAVDRWSADTAGVDDFSRYEVHAALLELADHDGDIDRAIELLSSGSEHAAYGSIICRLLAAGRRLEAVDWLDRAVAAGRISAIAYGSRNDYFVTPDQAVELYVNAGGPRMRWLCCRPPSSPASGRRVGMRCSNSPTLVRKEGRCGAARTGRPRRRH